MRNIAPILFVLPLLYACSAYDSRYEFEPRPLEFAHALPGADDRAASALVTVVGVHKRDAEQRIPPSVEVRLRVDNNSDEEIRLDPVGVQLFAANLLQFPEPTSPDGPLAVAPHGSGTLTVFFPFPDDKVPGAYDLEGLSARWTLVIGDRASTGNATFTRYSRDRDYYPVGIGFGFGISSWDYGHYHHHGHGFHDGGGFGHRPVAPGR
jgi:hypothetical protein